MTTELPLIEVDPEIMSGTPVIRGTRVPVESLFVNLASGLSLDEFLDCFPTVRREDAVAILHEAGKKTLAAVE